MPTNRKCERKIIPNSLSAIMSLWSWILENSFLASLRTRSAWSEYRAECAFNYWLAKGEIDSINQHIMARRARTDNSIRLIYFDIDLIDFLLAQLCLATKTINAREHNDCALSSAICFCWSTYCAWMLFFNLSHSPSHSWAVREQGFERNWNTIPAGIMLASASAAALCACGF